MSSEDSLKGIDALRDGSTTHRVVELVTDDGDSKLETKLFPDRARAYEYANQSTSREVYVYDVWDVLLSAKIASET